MSAAARDEQIRRDSVTRDEFHQRTGELATREDLRDVRAEMRAGFAEIRADLAELRTLLHRLLIGLVLLPVAVVIGFAARFVFGS